MGKIGLVLEGGAMRGLFTVGALDELMAAGIELDGTIGVSAGAAFGCNYKSRQAGRALRYNLRFCRDPRYCSWRNWLRTGDLFDARFCYRELPDKLDPFDCETYGRNPMEFFVVCTDVDTGEAIYHPCPVADAECFRWMRASASMPLVSNVVRCGERNCLDGAIADSIPLRFWESRGYERNLVILTQPPGYRKRPPAGLWLGRILLRRYPALLRAVATRHERYNRQVRYVEAQAEAGRFFLLRPNATLPTGRICHDPEILQRTYDAGRAAIRDRREELRDFLGWNAKK